MVTGDYYTGLLGIMITVIVGGLLGITEDC